MSKTVGSILAIAGGAALVASGIGAIGGLAVFGSISGISVSVAGISASLGTLLTASSILTGIGGLLATAGQKAPRAEQTETAVRQPTPPRLSGYGINRVYMAFALYVTAKTDEAIDVGVFHDGRVNAVRGAYLGDKKITYNSSGWVQTGEAEEFGKAGDKVRIGWRLGAPTETAFSEVISLIPDQWTNAHRGDGCATGFAIWKSIKSSDFQKVYPSGGPNNMPLSLVMELQPVFDWRDSSQTVSDPASWKFSENAILHLAHYLLVRDNKTWAKHFAPTLAYWTAAANDADIAMPLKGIQAVLTAAANQGAALIAVSSVAGLSVGMTIAIAATGNTALSETRTVTAISGLNLSIAGLSNSHPVGSQVTWSSSSGSPATEPRYRSCVVHKHTDEHKSVIAALLACADAWMSPRADGALVVYSGRYYPPTVTITDADIINISIQDGVEEEAAVNQIPITYVSENHDYSTVDTDAWTDEEDIERRGKILASSGIANQVPSHSQARRLAKRAYAEANAFPRGAATLRAPGSRILGERYIRIASATAAIDEVVQVKAPVKRDPISGRVSFTFIKADPQIDAWNPAIEEGDPAPVGNRIATPLLDPAVIQTIALDRSQTGTVDNSNGMTVSGVRLDIAGIGPAREDLTWYARYRERGDASWSAELEYTDIAAGAAVELVTGFVQITAALEVQITYSVGDGRIAPWSATYTISSDGSAIRVTEIGDLRITEAGDNRVGE